MQFPIPKTLLSCLKLFIKEDKGAIAVIFAIIVLPIMVLSGAAIDYSSASSIKTKMHVAVDAAVLAGAEVASISQDDDLLTRVASKMFHSSAINIAFVEQIEFSIIRIDGGVRATAKTTVKTVFFALIGKKEWDIVVSSEAATSSVQIEVALVLDNTGSMAGNRMVALKNSATSLVNELMPESESEVVKIGLVPFAKYVNIGAAYRNESWISVPSDNATKQWYGCVGSRNYPRDESDGNYIVNKVPGVLMNPYVWNPCINQTPIVPLTDEKQGVLAGINSMKAAGWTYIPAGLMWGWSALSSEAPFTEGEDYDEKVKKVLVLMTDGANTVRSFYPEHDGSSSYYGYANGKTKDICDNIKDEDIMVFTIAFEVNNNTIKDILKDCAGNSGGYFDASNSSELAAAFASITTSLLGLRLTK